MRMFVRFVQWFEYECDVWLFDVCFFVWRSTWENDAHGVGK